MRAFLFLGLTLMVFALQAQDDCLFTADITTSTGLWGDEVSWTLYTADGDVVAAQDGFESNATSTTTACLEDSCYVLEMLDTFGDGWNGAEVTISLPVLGLELGAYTLESGDYQALSIGFGDCPDNDWTGSGGGNGGGNGGGVVDTYGCMDPVASNCDPAATIHCCCEYDVDCTGSKTLTLVGVVTLAGTMFAVPMWIRNRMGGSLTAKDGELTGSQVQRGQFMNSGSRDVGRDPDWDGAVYRPKKPRKPS